MICGPCKVLNDILDNFLQSQPILSGINSPTYKLANFQVPILKSWTSNVLSGTHLLLLKKLFNKILIFWMRGLNADSLFTNIPLEETIDIWISTFFESNERVEV